LSVRFWAFNWLNWVILHSLSVRFPSSVHWSSLSFQIHCLQFRQLGWLRHPLSGQLPFRLSFINWAVIGSGLAWVWPGLACPSLGHYTTNNFLSAHNNWAWASSGLAWVWPVWVWALRLGLACPSGLSVCQSGLACLALVVWVQLVISSVGLSSLSVVFNCLNYLSNQLSVIAWVVIAFRLGQSLGLAGSASSVIVCH